ncbi:MAG: hypothetical protein AB1742_05815 [bacterium]
MKRPGVKTLAVVAAAAALTALACTRADAANKPQPLSAKFKPLTGAKAARTAAEIQDTLEAAAKGINSVYGTGTIENEFIRRKNVKEFSFWIKKPGKLRLEFTSPEDVRGVVMMTDGKTFWNHIPAMNKTYKVDLKQGGFEGRDKPLQKELGLLTALVNTPLERKAFWKKFEIVPLGDDAVDGRECYVVEFRTRAEDGKKNKAQQEGLFNQYLWIEKESGITRQIELLVFGAPELVKMKTIELNVEIGDALFSLGQ